MAAIAPEVHIRVLSPSEKLKQLVTAREDGSTDVSAIPECPDAMIRIFACVDSHSTSTVSYDAYAAVDAESVCFAQYLAARDETACLVPRVTSVEYMRWFETLRVESKTTARVALVVGFLDATTYPSLENAIDLLERAAATSYVDLCIVVCVAIVTKTGSSVWETLRKRIPCISTLSIVTTMDVELFKSSEAEASAQLDDDADDDDDDASVGPAAKRRDI